MLNGLNLGIPEGMITVILGPSGTGKSVLINHLIGLMFPDHGDILVHGKSVPNRRRSELFEMRREFGILFQDGALFGSMNVYDNVAFPLREQTNKSEEEIRQIVDHRLEEVGLAGAAQPHSERDLGRHEEARRLRPGARDGAQDRDVR